VAFFPSLSKNGLWAAPILFALGVLSLALLIADLARVVRGAHLLSVPVQDFQKVDFGEAGRVLLCLEGPLGSRGFAGLGFELAGPGGSPVPGRKILFRTVVSGFSRARMAYKVYDIPGPGSYALRIRGLDPGRPANASLAVVFMRPYLAASVIRIIGIVLASLLAVGGLVLFFLRLTSTAPAKP